MKRLLIAGCGDLGSRLAPRVIANGWHVTGLRRNPAGLPDGIAAVAADLNDPASLDAVAGHWDAIVYQATPDQRDPEGYRRAYVAGLANLAEHVDCDRLVFVSSTAVYGQDSGEWVDEDSATEPAAFNGEILLEAEHSARAWPAAAATVVRFSGIYGPGREYLIRMLREGRASCRETPPQWTNRIHADDCAGVLAHLLGLAEPPGLLCASDCRPAPRCEVLDWLAGQLSVDAPVRDPNATAGSGKRVSSERLRATGYRFGYPDYQTGYGALLT